MGILVFDYNFARVCAITIVITSGLAASLVRILVALGVVATVSVLIAWMSLGQA